MKLFKRIILSLLLISVSFGVGYYVCYEYAERPKETVYVETKPDVIYLPGEREKMVVTVEEVQIKLEEMSQFSTYSGIYNITKAADFSRMFLDDIVIPGTTNKVQIECEGIVKVGYDVEDIVPTVDNESFKIYVALPEPKVLDNYVIWDTVKCTENNNILNPIDFAQYQDLISEIEDLGLQEVLDNGIYKLAEENLKVVISNFLSGFIDYEIVYMGGTKK